MWDSLCAGETVGLIGPNGAGKTTLLKVLSRITEPTEGRAEFYGRAGALLEAGTGFHAELTGRENVYLNGAILGMPRATIRARFDEIVEFAGVERFLDTPVKRYSTGMYLRLGFAIAAHLDPDILLVDEVLAVGDAEFQKRCFAKMQEIGQAERAVIFVSHNMAAIRRVCTRALLLDRGRLADDGAVDQVIDQYLARTEESARENGGPSAETANFFVNEVRIYSPTSPIVKTFEPAIVRIMLTAKGDVRDPDLYVGFLTVDNQRLAGLDLRDFINGRPMREGERRVFEFAIDRFPLLGGSYRLEVHVKDMATHAIEIVPRLFPFEVAEVPVYGGRKLNAWVRIRRADRRRHGIRQRRRASQAVNDRRNLRPMPQAW
jgi:lipopolysaccharide transport system ATP-binding protein